MLCSLILAAMSSVAAQGLSLTHFQCPLEQTHFCFADGRALALRAPKGALGWSSAEANRAEEWNLSLDPTELFFPK